MSEIRANGSVARCRSVARRHRAARGRGRARAGGGERRATTRDDARGRATTRDGTRARSDRGARRPTREPIERRGDGVRGVDDGRARDGGGGRRASVDVGAERGADRRAMGRELRRAEENRGREAGDGVRGRGERRDATRDEGNARGNVRRGRASHRGVRGGGGVERDVASERRRVRRRVSNVGRGALGDGARRRDVVVGVFDDAE